MTAKCVPTFHRVQGLDTDHRKDLMEHRGHAQRRARRARCQPQYIHSKVNVLQILLPRSFEEL